MTLCLTLFLVLGFLPSALAHGNHPPARDPAQHIAHHAAAKKDAIGAAGRQSSVGREPSFYGSAPRLRRPEVFLIFWPSSLSKTAFTIKGQATVASSKTSVQRPPSSRGTNFPHETPSE